MGTAGVQFDDGTILELPWTDFWMQTSLAKIGGEATLDVRNDADYEKLVNGKIVAVEFRRSEVQQFEKMIDAIPDAESPSLFLEVRGRTLVVQPFSPEKRGDRLLLHRV